MIVAGDLNDGPGVDFFERQYLIHNVVAVVPGNLFNPQRMLRHAFIDRELKERNFTARFYDFIDEIPDRPLLPGPHPAFAGRQVGRFAELAD